MAKKSNYDKVDGKLQKISKTIGAIVVILSAITGFSSWINSQFQSVVVEQIDTLASEIKASDKKQDQAITRLELANLIQNDPYNVVAIEKMARYYFQELDGDLYMTQKYSDWAREYGGDTSIVVAGGK